MNEVKQILTGMKYVGESLKQTKNSFSNWRKKKKRIGGQSYHICRPNYHIANTEKGHFERRMAIKTHVLHSNTLWPGKVSRLPKPDPRPWYCLSNWFLSCGVVSPGFHTAGSIHRCPTHWGQFTLPGCDAISCRLVWAAGSSGERRQYQQHQLRWMGRTKTELGGCCGLCLERGLTTDILKPSQEDGHNV